MEEQNSKHVWPIILAVMIITIVVGGGAYWFQQTNQTVEKKPVVTTKDPKQNKCELSGGFYRDNQCFCKVNQSAYAVTSGTCVARVDTSKGTVQIIDVETKTEKDIGKIYSNTNLGFSLTVPQKWVDYGYYSETESTYRFKTYYDGDLVYFYADFSDWEKFQLMQIGRTTKQVWEIYQRNYEIVSDPLKKQYYWIGYKITETNDFVYYYNVIRQDAPNKYIEDGSPLPKIPADFKLLN